MKERWEETGQKVGEEVRNFVACPETGLIISIGES